MPFLAPFLHEQCLPGLHLTGSRSSHLQVHAGKGVSLPREQRAWAPPTHTCTRPGPGPGGALTPRAGRLCKPGAASIFCILPPAQTCPGEDSSFGACPTDQLSVSGAHLGSTHTKAESLHLSTQGHQAGSTLSAPVCPESSDGSAPSSSLRALESRGSKPPNGGCCQPPKIPQLAQYRHLPAVITHLRCG